MRVVILFLLILALSSNAEAIAVASDYLERDTLELIEGTSKIYRINLQNPDSYETGYKVTYDDKFMKALDFKEEYILPSKSSVTIEFNVTAPKYDKNNNLFKMSYTVHQLGGAGGGIGFLGKISKQFNLQVLKSPNKLHINYFNVIYAVILLVVIFFLCRKRAGRKSIKKKFKRGWVKAS